MRFTADGGMELLVQHPTAVNYFYGRYDKKRSPKYRRRFSSWVYLDVCKRYAHIVSMKIEGIDTVYFVNSLIKRVRLRARLKSFYEGGLLWHITKSS